MERKEWSKRGYLGIRVREQHIRQKTRKEQEIEEKLKHIREKGLGKEKNEMWKKKSEKAKDTWKFFCSFEFWKSLSGADHQLDFFDALSFWEKYFILCGILFNWFWHA